MNHPGSHGDPDHEEKPRLSRTALVLNEGALDTAQGEFQKMLLVRGRHAADLWKERETFLPKLRHPH